MADGGVCSQNSVRHRPSQSASERDQISLSPASQPDSHMLKISQDKTQRQEQAQWL